VGRFVVEGGRRLAGIFRVNGAKNAALPILAASVLVREPVTMENIPLGLSDVALMLEILRRAGVRIRPRGPHAVTVDASGPLEPVVPEDLMRRMRASLFLAGPFLARTGRVHLAEPGGCDIGQRPIDLHLKGLNALGVEFTPAPAAHLAGTATALRGTRIYLDYPSVGATENIMMAAVLAEGDTVIVNAAQEPEVVDLAQFLVRLGARIGGAGSSVIHIEGRRALTGGVTHPVIPDRIEAGTVALAAVITGGTVTLTDVVPEHLQALWQKLRDMGVDVEYQAGAGTVVVNAEGRPLRPVTVKTGPYPHFPTDLQPQMTAVLTQAEGASMVSETVFENRLRHAGELNRMGAHIRVAGNTAWIDGPTPLQGARVTATDLRAGAALVLAGLAARGTTPIEQAELVERGYEAWPERLTELGAVIYREDGDG
jgi:UDP-N-acetylglucosamine 1-carboxyvinyltransferase